MTSLLEHLEGTGYFDSLDMGLARLLQRVDGAGELTALGAALVSREARKGNVCVSLSHVALEPVADDEGMLDESKRWPAVEGILGRWLDGGLHRGDSVAAPFYGHLNIPASGERAGILDILAIRWIVTSSPPAWCCTRRSPFASCLPPTRPTPRG